MTIIMTIKREGIQCNKWTDRGTLTGYKQDKEEE